MDMCIGCNNEIEEQKDYKPVYCCNGFECGCMGLTINPIFCDDCQEQVFGEVGI